MLGDNNCLNCNQDLEKLPGKRQKVFCDSTCRSNYWQRAKKLEDSGMGHEAVVKYLATHFATKRKNTIKEVKEDLNEKKGKKTEKTSAAPDPSNKGEYLKWLRTQK